MSIRIRFKLAVAVSSSNKEENDLGNFKAEVVSDEPNEGGCWKTTVAAGATVTLDLDNITVASFLMLRATPKDPTETLTPVTLTLNGGATFVMDPVGTMQESYFLLTSSSITSVTLANADAAAVDIDVVIGTAGDAD